MLYIASVKYKLETILIPCCVYQWASQRVWSQKGNVWSLSPTPPSEPATRKWKKSGLPSEEKGTSHVHARFTVQVFLYLAPPPNPLIETPQEPHKLNIGWQILGYKRGVQWQVA